MIESTTGLCQLSGNTLLVVHTPPPAARDFSSLRRAGDAVLSFIELIPT